MQSSCTKLVGASGPPSVSMRMTNRYSIASNAAHSTTEER